jgi:hypothetical protein
MQRLVTASEEISPIARTVDNVELQYYSTNWKIRRIQSEKNKSRIAKIV